MKLEEFNKCVSQKIHPAKECKKKITVNEIPLIIADRFETKKHELEKQLNILKDKMGLNQKSKMNKSVNKTKPKKVLKPSLNLNDKKLSDKLSKINDKIQVIYNKDNENTKKVNKLIESKTSELQKGKNSTSLNTKKSLSNRN